MSDKKPHNKKPHKNSGKPLNAVERARALEALRKLEGQGASSAREEEQPTLESLRKLAERGGGKSGDQEAKEPKSEPTTPENIVPQDTLPDQTDDIAPDLDTETASAPTTPEADMAAGQQEAEEMETPTEKAPVRDDLPSSEETPQEDPGTTEAAPTDIPDAAPASDLAEVIDALSDRLADIEDNEEVFGKEEPSAPAEEDTAPAAEPAEEEEEAVLEEIFEEASPAKEAEPNKGEEDTSVPQDEPSPEEVMLALSDEWVTDDDSPTQEEDAPSSIDKEEEPDVDFIDYTDEPAAEELQGELTPEEENSDQTPTQAPSADSQEEATTSQTEDTATQEDTSPDIVDPKPEKEVKAPSDWAPGMEHRKADPACPLCRVSTSQGLDPDDDPAFEKAHADAAALWGEWEPLDKSGDWVARVKDMAETLDIDVEPEMIKAHFSNHRIEQPALGGKIQNELFLEQSDALNPRQRAIIDAVYRQRVLTTGQIEEVICRPGRKKDAARRAAKSDLKHLAAGHFLYRYYASEDDKQNLRDKPRGLASSGIWNLGKRAVPYIQRGYNLSFQPPYINYAAGLKKDTLVHDIRANGLFVSLAREINENDGTFETEWGKAQIGYDIPNWYGPGPLMLAFGFQHGTDWRRVQPDGFATLSLQTGIEVDGKKIPASILPFWLEYDRGTKDVKDVAQQLLAYHFAALAGAPGKRFPDLDLHGYAPPVLMVFAKAAQMKRVRKKMQELAQKEGITQGAPIFLALEKEWNSDPFVTGVCHSAWDQEGSDGGNFFSMLLRASLPLVRGKALPPGHVLRLDPQSAPYRGTGAHSAAQMSDKHSQREMRENEEIQKRNEAVKRTLQGLDEAGAEKRSEVAASSEHVEAPIPVASDETSTVDPHDPFADDTRAEVLRLQAQLEEAQRQLAEARSGSVEEPEGFYVPGLQPPPPAVPSGDPNWDGPQVAPPAVPSAPLQPQAMPQEELPPQTFDPAAEEPDPAALAALAEGGEIELEIELPEMPEAPEPAAPPEPPAYVLEHEKQRADEDPAQRGANPFPDLEGGDPEPPPPPPMPEPPPPPPMPEPPQETSEPVIPEDSPTTVRRRRRQG